MKMQNNSPPITRRGFLEKSATAAVLAAAAWDGEVQRTSGAEESPDALRGIVESIRDADVRAGMQAAVFKNLLPAAVEEAYPGHFNISADGGAYGGWATWPGLDSWQMAGAYLLLGRTRMVLDYFEFVKASQRANGDIPFAIFTGDTKPDGTHLNGLKHPDDVFSYDPPVREGLPQSSRESRRWIGLFTHWLHQAEALSTLGSVCYVLTAAEVFDHSGDREWLRTRLPSIEAAAKYLLSRKSSNGLVARSGFYTEMPPRYGWDGVAQCYVIHAFRELAAHYGRQRRQAPWRFMDGGGGPAPRRLPERILARGSFRRIRSC